MAASEIGVLNKRSGCATDRPRVTLNAPAVWICQVLADDDDRRVFVHHAMELGIEALNNSGVVDRPL